MFSLASLTAAACILGAVSATPVARDATCNPNFEGAPVSIIAVDTEWGVSPVLAGTGLKSDLGTRPLNGTAEWHVEQTGSANPTYIVKAITGGNNLVVDVEEIDSTKLTQIWEIECDQCLPGAWSSPSGGKFAAGCAIKSVPSGLCVQLEHASEFIGVGECNIGELAQRFDFWTTTWA
ncbi:hypothetical protein B0H13DRAFT_2655932 [Mycena leptocephala]|nr:hypothetical protein B0H13DRAFT_2655932 [Mycena leptocephala]